MQKEQEAVEACHLLAGTCLARVFDGFDGKSQPGSTAKEYFTAGCILILVLAHPGLVHGCF